MRTPLLLVLAASMILSQIACSDNISTSSPGGKIYFQDKFELADMSRWDFVWKDPVDFNWHASSENSRSGRYSSRGHYTLCDIKSPFTAPNLWETAGGLLGPRTYYVKYVYVRPTIGGWSNYIYSEESSYSVSTNYLLTVGPPASGLTFYYYDVYVGIASGDSNLHKQNSSPIAIGTDWTEPPGGLMDYGSYPSSFVGCPGGSWTRQFYKAFADPPYANGLEHAFFRGYVYIKSPESGGYKDQQRKLLYISGTSNGWGTIVSSEYFAAVDHVRLRVEVDTTKCDGTVWSAVPLADANDITFDAWHHVELEILLNKPGSSDGLVRLWVDGTKVGEKLSAAPRGTCTTGIQDVSFGFQIDNSMQGYAPGDEVRYWDDIVIADHYTGP